MKQGNKKKQKQFFYTKCKQATTVKFVISRQTSKNPVIFDWNTQILFVTYAKVTAKSRK